MSVVTGASGVAGAASDRVGAQARQQGLVDVVLLLFRVVMVVLFGSHALVGFGLFGGIDGAGAGLAAWSFDWFVTVAQVVLVLMVGTGLGFRTGAVLLSGMMAYAYFAVHQPMAVLPLHNMGEPAALYSWIFLLLAVVGAGRFAVRVR